MTRQRTHPAPIDVIEACLWAIGLVCVVWVGWNAAQRLVAQRAYEVALSEAIVEAPAVEPIPERSPHPPSGVPAARRTGDPIGRIEVPRLQLSAMIAEGDDDATLKKAVGHLPDTPLPWEPGNSALAGHRDTFFRMLRGVRIGDRLLLSAPEGRLEYRVRATQIVNPEDVWVLDPAPDTDLTLITCYPFSFIGKAPQRYVVHATRVNTRLGP